MPARHVEGQTMKHAHWTRFDAQWTRFALAALLLVTATPLMVQVGAQTGADETARLSAEIVRLKAEVDRAEADIRRTDSLAGEERAAAARNHERLTRERDRREKENRALQQRVAETRTRIASERARGEGYASAEAELKAREETLLTFFTAVADSMRARVESGLPWDTETRSDRILSLRRDLESGTATPDEAFARLLALLREETKSGDEVTLLNRPLTRQNGEVVNAQVLKLGNQGIVYIDDEGKKFGILEPRVDSSGTAWVWREELSLGERTAVKRAVAVKGGREAPQLAPLTVPLAGLETVEAREGGR